MDQQQYEIPVKPLKGKGDTVIRLGILSFVGCTFFAGIPAWIIGAKNLKNIKQGLVSESEKTRTLVGMILGIVNSVTALIIIVIFAAVMIFESSSGNTSAEDDLGGGRNAEQNRAFITGDCYAVGQYAQEYYTNPQGGKNSFIGFEIPVEYKFYKVGSFAIKNIYADSLIIIAKGVETGDDGKNPVTVTALITPHKVIPKGVN